MKKVLTSMDLQKKQIKKNGGGSQQNFVQNQIQAIAEQEYFNQKFK